MSSGALCTTVRCGDSGILHSLPFASALKSLGGTYLRRITCANPCADTLSITRLGDTIPMDHFNWMLMELNNDTAVVNVCIMLNIFFRDYIEVAEPNYLYESCARDPWDYYDKDEPKQISLTPDLIGMPTAWDYETGDPAIRVAVIDAGGVDYRHCDLGGNGIATLYPTSKVVGGWNLTFNTNELYNNSTSPHGTHAAGIIGALTNRDGICGLAAPEGVAGIAGGWGTLNGATDEGQGASLAGYTCWKGDNGFPETLNIQHIVGAILEASGHSANTGYGEASHIINASWNKSGTPQSESELLRRAVYESYRHSVSFVAARGNFGSSVNLSTDPAYPASFDGNWVISVGAALRNKTRSDFSSYENLDDAGMKGRFGVLDMIAPGGSQTPETYEAAMYTTHKNPPAFNQFSNFYRTSVAAPHVSGVLALMRSTTLTIPGFFAMPGTPLEPEDYEGILQATAERVNGQGSNYHQQRGWGHLQADNVYSRCAVEGFRAKHYSITNAQEFEFGSWETVSNYVFTSDVKKVGGVWQRDADFVMNNGQIREVTATYTLSGDDWNDDELFVWGRGDTNGTGGYNAANPNHRYSWTEVISGTGGVEPPSRYVPGIFHDNNLTVTCRTYQFKHDNAHLPKDEDIAFHFTVFGIPKGPTSVRESDDIPSAAELVLSPQPVGELLTVRVGLPAAGEYTFEITDMLGRRPLPEGREQLEAGTYLRHINTHELATGVYSFMVRSSSGITVARTFVKGGQR